MPSFLEQALKKAAAKRGFTGKKANRYVFGGMNNMGAMQGSKLTALGKAMQAKHDKKVGGF